MPLDDVDSDMTWGVDDVVTCGGTIGDAFVGKLWRCAVRRVFNTFRWEDDNVAAEAEDDTSCCLCLPAVSTDDELLDFVFEDRGGA